MWYLKKEKGKVEEWKGGREQGKKGGTFRKVKQNLGNERREYMYLY